MTDTDSIDNEVISASQSEASAVGYLLVQSPDDHSSIDILTQNTQYPLCKLFKDCCLPTLPYSNRDALQDALKYLRHGDTIIVPGLASIGGSIQDVTWLLRTIIIDKRSSLIGIQDHFEIHPGNHNSTNMAIFILLAALSGHSDSQDENVTASYGRVSLGRKQEIIELVKIGVLKTVIASRMGLSRTTVAKYARGINH